MNFPSVYPVACHTDHIGQGSTFVAIQGTKSNGIDFIPLALQKGATTIVIAEGADVPSSTLELLEQKNAQMLCVENTRKALAELSAKALGDPAKKLSIIGITGTKGKTTTAFMLEHILYNAGYKTALLSSVYNKIDQTVFSTQLTTNQPDYLHVFFEQCVQAGVEFVVMEVAAQAFTLDRVSGILFDGVIFTNFDQEHAEFYSTIEDYFAAKKQIFSQLHVNAPVIFNGDDTWCSKIAREQNYFTFGLKRNADIIGRILKNDPTGLKLELATTDEQCTVELPSIVGEFNAYNIVAAAGMAAALGVCLCNSKRALETFSGVPGRMQKHIVTNDIHYVIDYAHNPSSFVAVLSTLKLSYDYVIVVFGCGGERDKVKRPIMGGIAAHYADCVVLTTDNPRSEEQQTIVEEILVGVPAEYEHKIVIELDRKRAIEKSFDLAKKNTVIAVLGKGPDEYQLIKDEKIYFSEKMIIEQLKNPIAVTNNIYEISK